MGYVLFGIFCFVLGIFVGNDKLRSVLLGKSKIKIIPNGKPVEKRE